MDMDLSCKSKCQKLIAQSQSELKKVWSAIVAGTKPSKAPSSAAMKRIHVLCQCLTGRLQMIQGDALAFTPPGNGSHPSTMTFQQCFSTYFNMFQHSAAFCFYAERDFALSWLTMAAFDIVDSELCLNTCFKCSGP